MTVVKIGDKRLRPGRLIWEYFRGTDGRLHYRKLKIVKVNKPDIGKMAYINMSTFGVTPTKEYKRQVFMAKVFIDWGKNEKNAWSNVAGHYEVKSRISTRSGFLMP